MTWTISIVAGLLVWAALLAAGGWANREVSWEQQYRRHYRGRHRAI